jgi:hypothetical protein
VSRISEVPGIAAGFTGDVLAPVVSDVFTRDLPHNLAHGKGAKAPLRQLSSYFFFMLFLISSRVETYSLLPGSEANAFSMAANASACFSAPIATSA